MSKSFWLVIITLANGKQMEVSPEPRDNRREAREIAAYYKSFGTPAYVVKRHEWEAVR